MVLINVAKKVEKARNGLGLQSDEVIVAAWTTNPKGAIQRSAAFAIGGVAGAAVQAAVSKRKAADTPEAANGGGLAERFVTGQHAMVLTDRRLFLASLGALSGKPKQMVAEWARGDVVEIAVEETKVSYPMTLVFRDGSGVSCEGAKGTDPRALALARE